MIGAFILIVIPVLFTLCLLWAVIEETIAAKRLPFRMISWLVSVAVLSGILIYFFEV